MSPSTSTDRLYQLEALHAAICCVEDGSIPAGPERRQLIIMSLLQLAAEQTTLVYQTIQTAMDN
jgi:hypothetical protein